MVLGCLALRRVEAQLPGSNPIVLENAQTGNPPGEWDITGSGDPSIQGFTTDISVNRGQTINFKVNTTADAYQIDIYRLGYYGGLGARKVATILPTASLPQTQPPCLYDAATGLFDCGNWAASASWSVPANAVSGVYIARPVRLDTGGASHIVFIVRDDTGGSDLLFQTSDTTWQAYNTYGGNSLYAGPGPAPDGRAYKVSYNRPINIRGVGGSGHARSFLFSAEYPMIRWLEANGYNVSYVSGVDTDRRGSAALTQHKVFLSVGHDEYWSGQQRANVEAARGAGVHLGFFSGNQVFWKTRWENSIDGTGTPHRTLVCYKETAANAKIDPSPVWTGTWRDPRFSPPADGGRPENALSGQIFTVNADRYDPIVISSSEGKLRFWRNTGLGALIGGQSAQLPAGVLGYEWDEPLNNGFQPAGLVRLSTTSIPVDRRLLDYGSTYGPGVATHNLTIYRHSSGALVFGAGTVRWAWGLDATHDNPGPVADVRMKQATVNLFADMGVQPLTLQPGVVPATQSTDTIPPTSVILSPAGLQVTAWSPLTIYGTATDSGGGRPAAVELSVDGGATWHPATGAANWSAKLMIGAPGSVTIRSRATDDSGRIESPGPTVTITATGNSFSGTLWPPETTPIVADQDDPQPIELGVRFQSDHDGWITALRFYKSAANTGLHVGNLWANNGTLLATAAFEDETASGWQQVQLATPVPISAGVSYIASYHTDTGHYSRDPIYFAGRSVDRPPLRAPADGVAGFNGVYRYGASAFPTDTSQSANYWVDVVYSFSLDPDTTPPVITTRSPADGALNASTLSPMAAQFNEPMATLTISPATLALRDTQNNSVPASVTYNDLSRIAFLQPSIALGDSSTYALTIKGGLAGVSDVSGNVLPGDVMWSFTTEAAPNCPCTSWTLWPPEATPAIIDQDDPQPVELGVRFQTDLDGWITALRFYKSAANTGVHIGNLWANNGTLLATVIFTDESASGWQQAVLPTPVPILAGTSYIASYHTDTGHYSRDPFYFAGRSVDRPPLHAPADGVAGFNGVYRYGPSAFPTETALSANYWIDVVFGTPDSAAAPVFAPSGGTYGSSGFITLSSATLGAQIFYTTNGSTPTTSSTRYTGPIPVTSATTIKAFAVASFWTPSAIASASYTFQAAPPTFNPSGGAYSPPLSVTLSNASPGTQLRYTTNGSTPTSTSTLYTGPINVTATTTINAIAMANGWSESTVASATYSILAIPQPWLDTDIGSIGVAGSVSYSSGVFTCKGSGADIWGSADAFHFMYQPLSGNGEIIARVVSVQNTHSSAKAGVMIRETLAANSRNVMMLKPPGNSRVAFQRRTSTGGTTTSTSGSSVGAPYWVRLVRSGNTITGYSSSNGQSWTQVGSVSVSMSTTVQIGLAVTAHNNAVLNTSVFDNVSVTTPPVAPTSLTAGAVSSSQIVLSWANASNEAGYQIERKTGVAGTYAQIATVGAGVTAYTNSGLSSLTTYFYRIRSTNSLGDSAYTSEASATTFNVPPATPSGLNASPVSSNQINLSWTDVPNETGYKIERKTGAGGTYSQIATVSMGVTAYSSTGLSALTTYFYRVRATNAVGDSVYSAEASATTSNTVPVAPTGLNASAVSSNQINLSWSDVPNETGFKIERKTGAGGTYAQIATVGASVTTYTNTGLSAATTYFYRVRATNSAGDSVYSTESSSTTSNTVPVAPTGMTASAVSSNQINLSWGDVANETGFKIERKTGSGGTYAEIATVGASVTAYSNTGLAISTTYFYRVRATNEIGDSAYSAEASATTHSETGPAGLQGDYFNNSDFSSPALSRLDATVDFNWASGSPDPAIGVDTFSARWTGLVEPQYSQTYTFYTTSDDGIRLWVNDQLVINNWTDHAPTENSGTIALVAGQRYDVLLEFYENGGGAVAQLSWSSASQPKQIIPSGRLFTTVPKAPTSLNATAVGVSQINLGWTDAANNESGFRIEQSTDGVNFSEIATVGANVTVFNNTGLNPGTTYTYRVSAFSFIGSSSFSNPANATTGTLPAAPSNLAANAASAAQINLTWVDNSANETGFEVERKTGAGGTYAQIATIGAGVTTYTNTGLTAATTYFYRVRATNAFGDSAYSIEASATTSNTVPAAPAGLNATAVSSNQINLSWSDVSNETGFKIERKTGAGGSYAQIATVGAGVTVYTSTGLATATTYFYRVRATNEAGDSAYSAEDSATTYSATGPAGLQGDYFNNSDFTSPALSRLDATVDFNWASGSPDPAIGVDTFSARWTGLVEPQYSQTYTFYTISDDGIRLWVNGQLVINNWTDHAPTENSGTIALVAGQRYDVLLEFYENGGGAEAQLSWSSASQAKQIIPSSRLFTTVPKAPTSLLATAVGASQINLGWMDAANNEAGFKIEQSTDGVNFSEIATVGANVTVFNNTGLNPGTTYTYRVRAFSFIGSSLFSNPANATTGIVPAAPSGLAATPVSSAQINLAWVDNASNETGFKVERKTGAGGTYSQIATVGAGVTTYTNTGLAAATTYFYRVRATNSAGDSGYSIEASATTSNTVPAVPAALNASAISSNQISLSWSDVSNETGFKIERKTGAGGTYAQIATVGAGVTAYTNTGLTAATTYFYRVRATNAVGDSAYSAEDSATTLSAVPAAPGGLNASSSSSTQISLSWTDVANETGFKIERKTGAGGAYAQIATVGAGVTTYTNTGLTAATTYFYRVRATNAAGDSAYSTEDSATTTVPSFRAASSAGAASGVNSLTINKPAGTQPGDVMVASIAVRPSTATINASGWTLVRRMNNASGNANSLAVYYKVAGASEPASYAFTFSTSTGSAGGIQSFSGVDTVNPVDVEAGQNTGGGLTLTAPSVTTRFASDMIVTSHALASSATFTPPSGMTEAFDDSDQAAVGTVGEAIEGNYQLQTAVAATGTRTATASNDADVGNAHTLALKAK